MTKTRAKPVRGYVAVQPERQSTEGEKVGSLFLPVKRFENCLRGKVLAVGDDVDAVRVGDIVMYERQSAHKGQSDPIPASYFGGDEGSFAILVPVALDYKPTDSEDYEILERTKRRDELSERWRNQKNIPSEVLWELGKHNYELQRLHAKKSSGKRSRAFTRFEQAGMVVHQGIVAVVERHAEGCVDAV
jgi:co-chaperonin GroES (HSP10)